jgi:two-component system NtrC family sensor kinase
LQQNRALLHARNVLDHLPFGVLGLGTDGIVVQVNREAALLLGLAPELIVGEPMCTVLPPEICAWAGKISKDSCGYRTVTVQGAELLVKGITMTEEGEAGIIITIMKGQGETR